MFHSNLQLCIPEELKCCFYLMLKWGVSSCLRRPEKVTGTLPPWRPKAWHLLDAMNLKIGSQTMESDSTFSVTLSFSCQVYEWPLISPDWRLSSFGLNTFQWWRAHHWTFHLLKPASLKKPPSLKIHWSRINVFTIVVDFTFSLAPSHPPSFTFLTY